MISITGELTGPSLACLEQSEELRGYTRLRPDHGQPVNFVALLAGVKPVMDDWVPTSRFDEYVEVCRARGLYVTANAQVRDLDPDSGTVGVIGRDSLTTTRAVAHRVHDVVPEASIHLFVGHDRTIVDRTRWAGWYPLVSNGRASSKPWIDHYWFGAGLGYPSCCVRAFARHNNWSVNNMPYQAYRATRRPSPLCNSVMRFSGLTWAAHLPCRYDCAATMADAAAVRSAMRGHCPALADFIDLLTARPYLILNEWEAFGFTGTVLDGNTIRYRGVTLAPSNRPNLELFAALCDGSRLEIRDDLVVIFDDGGEVISVERCRAGGFAPRVPFILDYSAGIP